APPSRRTVTRTLLLLHRILGTVLGTDWLKKPRKSSKFLQTALARRCCFCLQIQDDVKSFEGDSKNKLPFLSLLRMPISPLRLREQLLERNTFQMNRSTAVRRPDFLSPKPTFGALGTVLA